MFARFMDPHSFYADQGSDPAFSYNFGSLFRPEAQNAVFLETMLLNDFFSLKTDVNVPLKKNREKIIFCWRPEGL